VVIVGGSSFVLNLGLSQQMQSAMIESWINTSTPTIVSPNLVPLHHAASWTYVKKEGKVETPMPIASWEVAISQEVPKKDTRTWVDSMINIRAFSDFMPRLCGAVGHDVITALSRNMITHFTGPVLLGKRPSGGMQGEINGLGDVNKLTVYVNGSSLPAVGLTIAAGAGFWVNHTRMSGLRLRDCRAIGENKEKLFELVKEVSEKNPLSVLALKNQRPAVINLSQQMLGFFDLKSNEAIHAASIENIGAAFTAWTKTFTPTGGFAELSADDYDFFLVNDFIASPEVVAHQRKLRATNPDKLSDANFLLCSKREVPEFFKDEEKIYKDMLTELPIAAKDRQTLHYAVRKDIII